jgi:hypothetical protein
MLMKGCKRKLTAKGEESAEMGECKVRKVKTLCVLCGSTSQIAPPTPVGFGRKMTMKCMRPFAP